MEIKAVPSINIKRDRGFDFDYLNSDVSRNVAQLISANYDAGVSCFSIIGSFGTGKSSFLWAFSKSIDIKEKANHFDLNKRKISEIINIVGDYESFSSRIEKELTDKNIEDLSKKGMVLICIDEFGKFLEFAAANNPEKELFAIQSFCEFISNPTLDILLITSLHQSFDAYSYKLTDSQRNEWKKVKGRLKEVPFNQPIENLFTLAIEHRALDVSPEKNVIKYLKELCEINENKNCFEVDGDYFKEIAEKIFPLDVLSSSILVNALQTYGQNERSLFTFLNETGSLGLDSIKKGASFTVYNVFDYLQFNYYSLLKSKFNPDYFSWQLIYDCLDRAQSEDRTASVLHSQLIKTIGLLGIFSKPSANIDSELLVKYLSNFYSKSEIENALSDLERMLILRFVKFNNSYKLFGGTDVDIESELMSAESQVEIKINDENINRYIKSIFSLKPVTARKFHYQTGTPRIFDFHIGREGRTQVSGEIDGVIQLIFTSEDISDVQATEPTTLRAFFTNYIEIENRFKELEKLKIVKKKIPRGDVVALREVDSLIDHEQISINELVNNGLYSQTTQWFYLDKLISINSYSDLLKQISLICAEIYRDTPIVNMELINKHKLSTPIKTARKHFLNHLVNHWEEPILGYDEKRFPADKTIYLSLLKANGIHREENGFYNLYAPNNPKNENLSKVWKTLEDFLAESSMQRTSIQAFHDLLQCPPIKLKQGVIDFLLPTFLFAKRGDYALFNDKSGLIIDLTDTVLDLVMKNPKDYYVSAFEIDNLRLKFFNKYRELLSQNDSDGISNESLIETIRPFLVIYSQLEEYSLNTKRLSSEAKKVRAALAKAEDIEYVFFEEFPKALGYKPHELLNDESLFDEYIINLQEVVKELRYSYKKLIDRFEEFIQKHVLYVEEPFLAYKASLQKRFSSLEEHKLLSNQIALLSRINSELDDRDSWLNSIATVLIGKPMYRFKDSDEEKLKEKFSNAIRELDNLVDIDDLDESKGQVYKIELTSKKQGLQKKVVQVPQSKINEIKKKVAEINSSLNLDKELRIAILTELLDKELNEES